jgi:hypothetical protein
MKILASLILSASIASANEIPVGDVAVNQTFAIRSGGQFQSVSLQSYEGKIVIIMLMTPWCPFCQSNASAVGDGLLGHFNASSRGSLRGKNAQGIAIESVLLSTEEAAQWDSVNASFASTNGYGQWGIDATISRSSPRRALGYFRGGFINSSNLYNWGEDRRRVVVLNMVRDSATHEYREIVINQNSFSSSDSAAARAAIDAIQPETITNPPAITTQPESTTINSGQTTMLTVAATGDAPLTYAWFRGASGTTTHPVGTNSATFTTPALFETESFWVRVTNAAHPTGADSEAATVTVLMSPVPLISTASSLSPGNLGGSYSTTLAAHGGTAPYTWTISGGALPAGITLSSAGVLSGIPTALGTSDFTVQLEDADGVTDSRAFSLRVSDLSIQTSSLLTSVRNVAFQQSLVGTGGTAPYNWGLSAGSLPTGLSLSSAGILSGKPSLTASSATFTVRLTDSTGIVVTRPLTLPVSAVFLPPTLLPISFPVLTIGADFSYSVTALNYPRSFAITGLPPGLKISTTTGVITGRPQASGLYNVQVRATNAGGASPVITVPLVVRALDKNFVGTFSGLVSRHPAVNNGLGGTLTVTTTSLGSYSIRLVGALANSAASGAAKAYTAKGFLAASAPQISLSIGGQTLALSFDPALGQMVGTLGAASVNAQRSFWSATTNPAESFAGYYSMAFDLADASDRGLPAIPQGTGFATFSVSLAGVLTTAGRTADGEAITSASFLSAAGDFWAYAPMYKNRGSLQGAMRITEDAQKHFAENEIAGALTWFKPTIAGRTYASTFGPLNLDVAGAYVAPASRGNVVLGLPAPGAVNLSFTGGGLASSSTDPDVSFILTDAYKADLKNAVNPGKVTLTLNPATGSISGTFDLRETTPALVRAKVPFQGQVVRLKNGTRKAVGYFLLPQIPAPGQAAAAAPILSGGITLE